MTPSTVNPILVELVRGPLIESVYRGCAAVVDADGDIKFSIGNVQDFTFPRSSVKSVQAVPLIESGGADAFGLTDAEIAVTCASHAGEPIHVELVRSILSKAGLDETALQCGTHWPMGKESGRALLRADAPATDLHNNCSGKHAGMLSACVHMGLPIDNYTQDDHPLQRQVSEALSYLSGDKVEHAVYGLDGCSLPNWPLTVRGMAQLFARISTGAHLDAARAAGFRRLIEAGFHAPEAMGGAGRLPTEILRAFPGKIYVKEGAEGVYCGALLQSGLGVAVKIEDGGRKASEIALATILGAFSDEDVREDEVLKRFAGGPIKTWSGIEVGKIGASDEFHNALKS